jgi:hypothetical protein
MIIIFSSVRNTITSAAQAGREPRNSMISHRWRVPARTIAIGSSTMVSMALMLRRPLPMYPRHPWTHCEQA